MKVGEVEIGGETSTNNESLTNGRIKEKRGEHEIEIISKDLGLKDKKIRLILVNKEEREKAEQEIWRKINQPDTELCYIFSKKDGEFYIP